MEPTHRKIQALVDMFLNGELLLPEMQRKYVCFANGAELREARQYVRLRALRKQRSCSHALRASRATLCGSTVTVTKLGSKKEGSHDGYTTEKQ